MYNHAFTCTVCDWKSKPDISLLKCTKCHNPLKIEYFNEKNSPSIFPYLQNIPVLTPISSLDQYISLGEGSTPIINLPNIFSNLNISLKAKLEFLNPTGSFKDRGSAMMLSMLKQMKVQDIVEDSSGNAGGSISAYSSRAGINAHIFVPESAPKPKVDQIKIYGAQTYSIAGTRDETTIAAEKFVREKKFVYASHNLNPYFIEGTKFAGYEIYDYFKNDMPDHIIIPVGNGSLYIGIWKALKELENSGLSFDFPKLHAIQSENVMPLVNASKGIPWNTLDAKPTIAGGIAVSNPPRKSEIMNVLRDSSGTAISISESEISKYQIELAQKEGIYCEPTCATSFAAIPKLISKKVISTEEKILIPITGFGLKDIPPSM
tara:strand:- start:660 stop:1787 length:1128 start_codon:yes stop_codon:yes gene_type:complete